MAEGVSAAIRHLGANRFRDAIRILRDVLKRQPGDVQAMNALGIAYLRNGDPARAVKAIAGAIRANPKIGYSHNNLGEVYRARGDFRRAAESYRKAIALDADFTDAHYNLGLVQEQLGQLGDALGSYRRALELRPDDPDILVALAGALVAAQEYNEAEPLLHAAIALSPRRAGLHNNLGIVLKNSDKPEQAIECYSEAIRLDPAFAEAHCNMGVALTLAGRPADALAFHDRALMLKPDHPRSLRNRYNTLCDLGRADEVIARYDQAGTAQHSDPEDHFSLGIAYKSLGRTDNAIAQFGKALALAPDHTGALCELAGSRSGALDEIMIETMKRLYGDPSCGRATRIRLAFGLGDVFETREAYGEAFEYYREGNRLTRLETDYSASDTVELFDQIEANVRPGRMEALAGAANPSAMPVFIIGMPRSGTTLAEQILAGHPEVHAAGELTALGAIVSNLRTLHGEPAFPGRMDELEADAVMQAAGDYLARLDEGRDPSTSRVTDKMPHNFLYAGLIATLFPNARIVHMCRDPMDTCCSIFTTSFLRGHGYGCDLADLGHYYGLYERLMAHWRVMFPGRVLDVDYETLTGNLETETRRMLDFCGLPFDARCLEFQTVKRNVATASAWQVRKSLYRDSVGKWRRYEKQLAPLQAALGAAAAPNAP